MAASFAKWAHLWRRAGTGALRSPKFRPAASALPHRSATASRQPFVRHQSQWPFGSSQRTQYQRFGQQQYQRPGPVGRIMAIWMNHPRVVIGLVGGCGGIYLYGLEKVEISGRWRFNILSPQMEASLTQGAYESMLQEEKSKLLPVSHPYVQLCQRVVSRLVNANGLGGQKWVVHVIRDDSNPNAFVLPGGQVFVYTGILPIAEDEAGLAAVLGHEIAHKVARHQAERISGRLWALLFVVAAVTIGDVSGDLARFAYNLIFDLRNSRTQEAEADQLGLLMMARSCYDPHSATRLWTNMVEMEHAKNQSVPEFLSTHPASEHRIESIESWIPKAMEVAEQSNCYNTQSRFQDFSHALGLGDRGQPRMPQQVPVSTRKSDDDWF